MNFKRIDMHTAGIYVCLYLLMFKTLAVARGGYSHSRRIPLSLANILCDIDRVRY